MSAVPDASASPRVASPSGQSFAARWQSGFLELLPPIERDIRIAFRHLPGESREEAVQEAICNACVAYARLAAWPGMPCPIAGSVAASAAD